MLFQDCTSHLIALLKNLLHLEINQRSHACTAGIIASRRHIYTHRECSLVIGYITSVEQQPTISINNERTGLFWESLGVNPAHIQTHTTRFIVGKHDTYLLAHTPASNHTSCEVCYNLEIVFSPCGNTFWSKGQFFSSTSSQADGNTRHQCFTAIVIAIFLGGKLRHTQALPPPSNGYALDSVGLC